MWVAEGPKFYVILICYEHKNISVEDYNAFINEINGGNILSSEVLHIIKFTFIDYLFVVFFVDKKIVYNNCVCY